MSACAARAIFIDCRDEMLLSPHVAGKADADDAFDIYDRFRWYDIIDMS